MEREKKRKGRLGLLIAVVAILVFGAVTAYNYWKFKTRKEETIKKEIIVPVVTEAARNMKLDWVLEQMGDLRPLQEVYVTPKLAGKIIEKIPVEKGDFVRKGDLVAVLEKEIIRAQIMEAKAGLVSAKARLNEVEANLDVIRKDQVRMGKLVKKHAVSQQKMDQIEAQFKAAQASRKLAMAQIKKAQASLNLLDILLKDHDVRAPISGYVSARYVDAGGMSDTKKPIIRISDESAIKIVTSVAEQDYPHIKKGMEAEVYVDAFPDRVFKGSVSVLNPTLDPATRTGLIEIDVSNPGLLLHSGMYARIRLHLGSRSALVIPRDGLNRLPGTGSYYVYVVEQGHAVVKNIKIGRIQGDLVEVRQGLGQGEQVVIKGQNRLKDGTKVKIKEEAGNRKEEGGRGEGK